MKARVVKGWDSSSNEDGYMIQIKEKGKRNYEKTLFENKVPYWTTDKKEANTRCKEFNLKHNINL